MDKLDDIDLIQRFKDGDLSCFEGIVLKYQNKVYNLCRYMLGNAQDAEDAAQDVFIKAYRKLGNFKPEAALYTWLYRIGVNTCIDYKRKYRDSSQNTPSHADGLSPENLYQSKETIRTITHALSALPEKLRAVIVLREVEALSYEEIAKILNISLGTVKSRISRARELLLCNLKTDGTIS